MLDDVVWLPAHIDGIATTGRLGAGFADRVLVEPAPYSAAGGER